MIASKTLPEEFRKWNEKHGAPFGKRQWTKQLVPWRVYQRLAGPFSVQPNNTTREFEYPWAFYATPVTSALRVLEIGGGLSGLQFILDRSGCSVINVDPGLDANGSGWFCDPSAMAKLNHIFGTSVKLYNTTISNADLESGSFDRIFSISVLEHLSDEELESVMCKAFRWLKPNGYFIATIDLFLNVKPFTSRERNQYGKNINLKNLIETAPFVLVQGNRKELHGYPEFDSDRVQSNLEDYFIGLYPTLVQCFVAMKPGH